jgi:alanine racemase
MTQYPDSRLVIDLNALAANYQFLKAKAEGTLCAGVVKANAYGMGVEPVAKRLAKEGCTQFFVATLDEALELRKVIKKQEVAVFHGVRAGQEKELIAQNITPVINDIYQLDVWLAAAKKAAQKLPVILHFDTGMNRLGMHFESAADVALKLASGALDVRYVMSHLACANELEHALNKTQLKHFNTVRKHFPGVPVSLANSAGVFLGDCYHFNMVRPGVALYGVSPMHQEGVMQPVANVYAKVLQIRTLKKAETVGYGATQTVPAGHRLAVVPVGYADGYMRSLSRKGAAFAEGKLLPLVGRVSMDLIVLDVTDIPEARLTVGTEVELLGANVTVDKLAREAGTIGYEILTRLGSRFEKEYKGSV